MEFTNDTDLSEIRSMLTEHMRENYPLSQKSFELWYSYLKLVYLDTEKAVFRLRYRDKAQRSSPTITSIL